MSSRATISPMSSRATMASMSNPPHDHVEADAVAQHRVDESRDDPFGLPPLPAQKPPDDSEPLANPIHLNKRISHIRILR